IAVSAGVWLGSARPGDVVEIISDDRAFDAVGDVAALLGVEFRRLSYRRLTGIAPAEEPAEQPPQAPREGRGRRRRGPRPGGAGAGGAAGPAPPRRRRVRPREPAWIPRQARTPPRTTRWWRSSASWPNVPPTAPCSSTRSPVRSRSAASAARRAPRV